MSNKVLKWCEKHDEPVWVYSDGSWCCMWQLKVETGDETQCCIVDYIPAKYLVKGDSK